MLRRVKDPFDPAEPPWIERFATRWTERRSPAALALLALAAIALFGMLDGAVTELVGFDFVVTVLYIGPIGLAAWAAGPRTGVLAAVFAAAVEAVATWWGARGEIRPWILGVSVGLELLVFLGAAFTFARLRWHMERQRQLSRTDPLTGLANQRAFEQAVGAERARVGRRPAPTSVAYLDVDHFKELNDTRGHSAGNDCLRHIGDALRTTVRTVDVPARLGGDEFAVLFPGTGAEQCRTAVERLRERLRIELGDRGFPVTLSVGAVTFEQGLPPHDEILAAADRAMYRVKTGTRDGFHHDLAGTGDGAAPPGGG